MKTLFVVGAAMVAVCGGAHANAFSGPSVGLEVAQEDFGRNDGVASAITLGWDLAARERWVIGAGLRVTLDGVEQAETRTLGANTATSRVAFEEQWSLSARAGYVFAERLLVFGELGHERFHVDAVRELRAQVCAPPNGCLISRLDASFDEEMTTYGLGVEWAATDQWRLRGAYSRGESDAFDRDRFALSTHFQF